MRSWSSGLFINELILVSSVVHFCFCFKYLTLHVIPALTNKIVLLNWMFYCIPKVSFKLMFFSVLLVQKEERETLINTFRHLVRFSFLSILFDLVVYSWKIGMRDLFYSDSEIFMFIINITQHISTWTRFFFTKSDICT